MIAFTGSHGTGKSTLLKELKLIIPNLYITDGFSRPIKKVREVVVFSKETEQRIINELTIWNWESNIDNNLFATARTPIDTAAYSAFFLTMRIAKEILDRFYKSLQGKSFHIFYTPIEFPIIDDGIRFTDDKFQTEIDNFIVKALKEYNIPYTTLTGSVEERVQIIKKTLNL